jgi:hypothetical protein
MVKAGGMDVDDPVSPAVVAVGGEKAEDSKGPLPVRVVLGMDPEIEPVPPVVELEVDRLDRPPALRQSSDRDGRVGRIPLAQDGEVAFHFSSRDALGVADIHGDSIDLVIHPVPQAPSPAAERFGRRIVNLDGPALLR